MAKQLSSKESVGVILAATKADTELALIPINGKPAIFVILDHFKSLGVKKAYVSVGYQQEKMKKLLNAYADKDFTVEAVKKIPKIKKGIKIIKAGKEFDFSDLKNYYRAKARLFPTRSFNTLRGNELLSSVVKRSKHNDKLRDEISWYLNIPDELKIHAPRVVKHNIKKGKEIFMELEFYGYPSLSQLYVYGELPEEVWEVALERVLQVVETFRSYKKVVPQSDYTTMYASKIDARVQDAKKQSKTLADLLNTEYVLVNGKKLRGWPAFSSQLKKLAKSLYDKKDNSFLHGDLCFPNILFDLNSSVVKLVDPRGSWGSQSFYGDIKYDVAKLRHSVSGLVDHMLYNHVRVSYTPSKNKGGFPAITTSFPLVTDVHKKMSLYFDKIIQKDWDLDQIKLIEALLFISMLPLHNDSEDRQIAMFARGITLLNELS